ncbi:MAG: alcohol dehydrogenase [Sulfobacillus benefaciens]|uniref:Alcohol dehydrogenase n=1 Tax=Sulfobacillus benefaciens TaxID=453960 RepID=A0A2T2XH78_9FIRM|nr:MAG: alcohol dehydrogenase [Sulfobacillus benefaciens]
MKGVVYDFKPDRWLAAHVAGRHIPALYDGPLSCLSLRTMPSKPLPGPKWVRLRPLLSGVCGSDLATITTHASPVLSAFTAFPIVLGHEMVAEVLEVGPAVQRVAVGQRIVVQPFFGCEVREIVPPCLPCSQGYPALCQNAAEGRLAPGMLLGFCPDEPGGWSDESVCHESQCYLVPDELSLEQAVLIEPLAVGLHAVLLHPPHSSDKVLVIGGGMIAFAVLAALAWLNTGASVVHSFWEPFQADLSRQFGAQFQAIRENSDELIERVGGRSYRPRFGPSVSVGGYDIVVDCVGSSASMGTAIRTVRPQGTVVLVGAAAHLPGVDWTFVWNREIQLLGALAYGPEANYGHLHTFEATMRYLKSSLLPVEKLITHRMPLHDYRTAIRANLNRNQYHAIKTVFDFSIQHA